MAGPVKLSLSSSVAPSRRDLWRPLSDVVGGALALAVWILLWAWVAVGVVGPLSSLAGRAGDAPAARYAERI